MVFSSNKNEHLGFLGSALKPCAEVSLTTPSQHHNEVLFDGFLEGISGAGLVPFPVRASQEVEKIPVFLLFLFSLIYGKRVRCGHDLAVGF